MSELLDYYQRFYQVLLDDIDTLLTEPDPSKRSAKAIEDRLKMAKTCSEVLDQLEPSSDMDWEQLSESAKQQITEIIEKDLESK